MVVTAWRRPLGGVAGSPGGGRLAVSSICAVTEIHVWSAAGGSDGCYGSWFVSDGSNQGNIFELTDLFSGVSKKTAPELRRPSKIA